MHSESLRDALRTTLLDDAQLAAERSHVLEIEREQLSLARSNWLPTLSVTADGGIRDQTYDYVPSLFPIPPATGTFRPNDVIASLSETLFRGGRTTAEVRAARAAVQAAFARLASKEESVLGDAAKSYFAVLEEQEIEHLSRTDVAKLQRVLQGVQEQLLSGSVTRTDVLQAKARLGSSLLDLQQANEALSTAKLEYAEHVGHSPGYLIREPWPVAAPRSLREALQITEDTNPDLIAARMDALQARFKIDDLRGQLLPTVTLAIGYKISNHPVVEQEFELTPRKILDASALVSISVPLFQPGVQSQISGARHAARMAEFTALDTERKSITQTRIAWISLLSARYRLRGAAAIVDQSLQALQGIAAEQAAGSRTVVDVLNGERDVISAKLTYVRAEQQVGNAEVDLATAMGLFDDAHLRIAQDDTTRDYWNEALP